MNEVAISQDRPLARRIVDYPLVAMMAAIALYVIVLGIAGALAMFALPATPGLSFEMKVDLVALPLVVLLYKLVIARLGDVPRDDLRARGALRPLALGLIVGLVLFSACVAVAALLGVYRIVGVGSLNGLLPALVMSAIFPAISEEILFRGILFRWIEEFGGSWLALLVTSLLFGAAHLLNPHASPVAAIGIALEAGVMLGAAYMLTRSLWLPIGLHAAWNFTQGEIYDIPVSGRDVNALVVARLDGPPLLTGNGFGLEASLIAIAVATLFGFWLLWRAIRAGQLVQPSWLGRSAG